MVVKKRAAMEAKPDGFLTIARKARASDASISLFVMAGLVPAIHVFLA
jgi:hypothetical protein